MNAGVIENCGKYNKIAPAGLICLMWPCQNLVNIVSLKIQALEIHCDTKTKDNVFVKVIVSGQQFKFY